MAVRIGLVEEVVDDAQLDLRVSLLVDKAAAMAPSAVATIKGNLDDASELPLGEYLEEESRRFLKNMDSADSREAVPPSSKSDRLGSPELTDERVSPFAEKVG